MEPRRLARMPIALPLVVFFLVVQDSLTLVGIQGPFTVLMIAALILEALISASRPRTAFSSKAVAWPMTWFIVWATFLLVALNPSIIGLQNLLVWMMFPLVIATVYAGAEAGTYARFYPWVRRAAILASFLYLAQVAVAGIGSNDMLYSARGAGWLAMLALIIVLPRVVLFRESWWPVLLLLAIIVLSLSRTPMAISAVMIVIAWALRDFRGQPPTGARFVTRLLVVGVITLGGLVWAMQNVPFISERFTEGDGFAIGGIEINSSGRSVLWDLTVQQWMQSPWIGNGTGSAQEMITARYPGYISHPHNEYLRLLDDTGIVGLVLWSLGILFFAVRATVALAKAKDPESRAIHVSAILGLLVMVFGSITDNVTISLYIPLVVGAMLGLSAQRTNDDTYVPVVEARAPLLLRRARALR